MKKVLAVFIILLIGLNGSGCMNSYKTLEENKTKSEVLEYLTEKYGEEFEIAGIARRNIAIPYNETAVFPKKNPELVFAVREENGQFVDSYYGVLIETEYNSMLCEYVERYLDSPKVYSKFMSKYFDDRFKPGITLDEALSIDKNQFFASNYVFVKDDVTSNSFDELCSGIESEKWTLYVAVYKVSEEDWGKLSADNYSQYLSDNYTMNPIFKKVIKLGE